MNLFFTNIELLTNKLDRNSIYFMKKKKISEFDNETLDRVVAMAQEEKKPFEVLKEEFGVTENEVTELMRKRLSKDNFELWKNASFS